MSYSIVRVSKVKSGTNTTGIQKHVQRENNNYENEDIDHSKTCLLYTSPSPRDYAASR
ncbi:plasmid recombination protein, partial [Staphylococcus aureus]|nr:plasmid recombination protein [Staphylococcus aureus]